METENVKQYIAVLTRFYWFPSLLFGSYEYLCAQNDKFPINTFTSRVINFMRWNAKLILTLLNCNPKIFKFENYMCTLGKNIKVSSYIKST